MGDGRSSGSDECKGDVVEVGVCQSTSVLCACPREFVD